MPGDKVLVERRGAVTLLTINRPEVRNCIDAETADGLTAAIEEFGADDQARVLVVTGTGDKAFCAGADLKAIDELIGRPGAVEHAPLGFSNLEPDKPRVAAVEGYCVGGGIELACWCDFAVAGDGAVFAALNREAGVPWVDGGTQRMTRRIGTGNALYLLETGERVDASRALAMGLVQEVVPHGQALTRALEVAERIASYGQTSLRSDRRSALTTFGVPLEEGLVLEAERGNPTAEHPEFTDGVQKFRERRAEEGGGAADALHP
jgi:enoyl-CoA hydratase/carnithine racemase